MAQRRHPRPGRYRRAEHAGVHDPRHHGPAQPLLHPPVRRRGARGRRRPKLARECGPPIVTTGASQGGGLAIAAAHLAGGIAATLPDVPFLAHPQRALEVTDTSPYRELADYCKVRPDRVDQVFATLAYINVVNHARRARAAALFSVGLTDTITPPSTIFAAFNHYAGPKDIAVYPYSGHEGGGTRHFLAQLAYLRQAGLSPR